MNMDILDLMWQQMQDNVRRVQRRGETLSMRSERAETAGGCISVLYAELPNAAGGAASGDLAFVTNGRKSGEAAGAGTGVPCYYNQSDDKWYRFSDDTAVSI